MNLSVEALIGFSVQDLGFRPLGVEALALGIKPRKVLGWDRFPNLRLRVLTGAQEPLKTHI